MLRVPQGAFETLNEMLGSKNLAAESKSVFREKSLEFPVQSDDFEGSKFVAPSSSNCSVQESLQISSFSSVSTKQQSDENEFKTKSISWADMVDEDDESAILSNQDSTQSFPSQENDSDGLSDSGTDDSSKQKPRYTCKKNQSLLHVEKEHNENYNNILVLPQLLNSVETSSQIKSSTNTIDKIPASSRHHPLSIVHDPYRLTGYKYANAICVIGDNSKMSPFFVSTAQPRHSNAFSTISS